MFGKMKRLDLKKAIGHIKDVFRTEVVTAINALIDRKNGVGTGNYKRYVAVVSQTSTDAPTAIVLENTFKMIPVWTYSTDGSYNLTITNAFPDASKVFVLVSDGRYANFDATYIAVTVVGVWATSSIINFQTTLTGAVPSNGLLSSTSIELRVYN